MADAVVAHRLFAAFEAPGGTVVALQGLSLRVAEGELLAVVGPSGSGKSTMLRCLAGRARPLAGELTVPAPVAMVHQRYARALSPTCRCGGSWPCGRRCSAGRAGAAARGRSSCSSASASAAAATPCAPSSPASSSGWRLCAALAAQPRLLLADEITGELDDDAGARVLATLRELANAEGTTVVLATHDEKAVAVAVCDRTVTIRDGRVTGELAHGPTDRSRVMIDDGGVLRIDPEELAAAGVEGEARLEVRPGRIVLAGDAGRARPREEPRLRPPVRLDLAARPVAAVLDGATRRFPGRGRPAVDRVGLTLVPGLRHVLSGPSGCGKTTLLHLIAGLDRADAGTIAVAGLELGPLTRSQLAELRARHVAIVPQAATLVPFLDARENVELALTARGIGGPEARERADEALALVALEDVAQRPAGQLSSGQRQRVAVARALAARAGVLLADEPTANLDERTAVLIASRLAETARAHGTAVLCATHDHSVEHLADVTIRLRSGRVVGREEPEALVG